MSADQSRTPRLSFDPEAYRILIDDSPILLSKTEFRVLQYLVDQKGTPCSRRQIIDAVQGENYPVTERSIDVQIAYLRKKLGDAGKLIRTVRGVGFRFQE